MDQNIPDINDEIKKEIQTILVNKILNSLETHKIDLPQMKAISSYILDHFNTVENYSQLIAFLNDLQTKWTIFKDEYEIYKNKLVKEQEKSVMNKLSTYITNKQIN